MINSVSSAPLHQNWTHRPGSHDGPHPQSELNGAKPGSAQDLAGHPTGRDGLKATAGVVTDTTVLSEEAQREVQKLRSTDQSVRQHEAAHKAAGGGIAGGISLTTVRGPDGRNYAVAGEVPIDMSGEGSPQATIAKMDKVKAAAMAPADPSPQDRRIAQQADAAKLEARKELLEQQGAAGSSVAPEDTTDSDAQAEDGSTGPKTRGNRQDDRTARAISAYGVAGAIFTPRSNGPGVWA